MKTNAILLMTALSLTLAPASWSQDKQHEETSQGHSHTMAELHGGGVTMTPSHHFEAVFAAEEIRLYSYDGKQKPINEMKNAKATLTLQAKDGKPKTVTLTYVAPDSKAGRSQGYFSGAYKFGEVKEGQMKASFSVSGMTKESIKFKTAVNVTELAMYSCPMHADIMGEDPVACSKCGMALTKKSHDMGGHGEKKEDHDGGHDH